MKLTLDFFQKLQKGLEYKKLELIKDCSVALQAFVGEPKKAIKQKTEPEKEILPEPVEKVPRVKPAKSRLFNKDKLKTFYNEMDDLNRQLNQLNRKIK